MFHFIVKVVQVINFKYFLEHLCYQYKEKNVFIEMYVCDYNTKFYFIIVKTNVKLTELSNISEKLNYYCIIVKHYRYAFNILNAWLK